MRWLRYPSCERMWSKHTRWLPYEVAPEGAESRVGARFGCGTQAFQVSSVSLMLISTSAHIFKMLCSHCRGAVRCSVQEHMPLLQSLLPSTLHQHNFAKPRMNPPLTASTNAFVQALPVPEQRAALHHVYFTEGQTAHTQRPSNAQSPELLSLISSEPARSRPERERMTGNPSESSVLGATPPG